MSYDAGRLEERFVGPGDATPIGSVYPARPRPRRDTSTAHTDRPRQAAAARWRSRMRRLLPVALAVVAVLVFVSLTEGGNKARAAQPITSYLGQLLEKLGLGLSEVALRGQRMTGDSQIYDQLQLDGSRSIWLLDTEAARLRIETLPWVLKASLKRVFPDRLQIDIQERIPRAIWSDGHEARLIDATGRVLGPPVAGRFGALPTIFGAGAAPHADAIVTRISRVPALSGKVAVYQWTAGRRWTLHLNSGRQILLPAAGLGIAVLRLTRGEPGRRLLDCDFLKLDLRVASQAAIELAE